MTLMLPPRVELPICCRLLQIDTGLPDIRSVLRFSAMEITAEQLASIQ